MLTEWEQQAETFLTDVTAFWNASREKNANGVTFKTQAEEYLITVNDPELQAANTAYFAAVTAVATIANNLALFPKSLTAASSDLAKIVDLYRTELSAQEDLLPKVTEFVRDAALFDTAVTSGIQQQFEGLVTTAVGPLKAELADINNLRLTAMRLEFKLEQLDLAYADPKVVAKFSLVPDSWRENTREALVAAKPEFIDAMERFRPRFDEVRRFLFNETEKVKREFVERLGMIQSEPMPAFAPIEYWDIDDLEGIRPKQ
jgi:hypothetical protein